MPRSDGAVQRPRLERALLAFAVAWMPQVDSYYANDGTNHIADAANGEFGPDLGGFIPFARFDDRRALLGHVLARRFDEAQAGQSFRSLMLENFHDLRRLDAKLRQFAGTALLPLAAAEASQDGPVTKRATWWGRPFTLFPYRVHGGPALVCIADDTLTAAPTDRHLLLVNLSSHPSDFARNENPLTTWFTAPSGGSSGPVGAPFLSPSEQALERGDVVVVTQENLSESLWIALQRTQECEWFVREQLLPSLGVKLDAAVSRSYLIGHSWGGLVSTMLALLQPQVWAGAGEFLVDDLGYGVGDSKLLKTLHQTATGMLPPELPNDPFFAPFYAMVDVLGTRFDAPQTMADGTRMQPWDLGGFSLATRRRELAVPVRGFMSGEDWIVNLHWMADGARANPLFQVEPRQFTDHDGVFGARDGVNEYSIWSGDEWDRLLKSGTLAGAPQPLVPTTPPPPTRPVYPDPYSHTLRHHHVADANEDFLSVADLSPAGDGSNAATPFLGQGVWPAWNDSLFVGQLDGDAAIEVAFGNLDGHVHVMEIDANRDPTDPLRLRDEWMSPYLGWGIFSLTVAGNGPNAQILASDALGQIWKIQSGGGSYTVGATPFLSAAAAPQFLYEGPNQHLKVGDFASALPGLELLVFNRFCDWSLFSLATGQPIPGGRLQRSLHATGPASATVCDINGDGDDELLVPSIDGHLWLLDPGADGSFATATEANPVLWSTFTGRMIYRVEPVHFGTGGALSHLLVFSRSDELDSRVPPMSRNRIALVDVLTRKLAGEMDADPEDTFDPPAFAWLKRPQAGQGAAFVIAGANLVQKYLLRHVPVGATTGSTSGANGGTTLSLRFGGQIKMIDPDQSQGPGAHVTALETFSVSGPRYVLVALGNGRFLTLDTHLEPVRTSAQEYGDDPDVTGTRPARTWWSNRSLARTFALDLVQSKPGAPASLYFADFSARYLRGPNRFRLGRVEIPLSGAPTFDPFVSAVEHGAGNPLNADFTRRLRMVDLDGDGQLEPVTFAESGDLHFDALSATTRQFCTVAFNPSFFHDDDLGKARMLGGYLFERKDDPLDPYAYLSGFSIPRDPTVAYADNGGSDWWYPRVGAHRLDGQIAAPTQSAFAHTLGASLRVVDLPGASGPSTPRPHVVVGTAGGYVYAVEPGPASTISSGGIPSQLGYASVDLGSIVLGLDAGELDGDPDQELVVGTLLDTGSSIDWERGNVSANRAQLVVLDPQASLGASGVGTFDMTRIDGDDRFGPGGGLGAGVSGVRVDDVDGDGVAEIWCGDAVGHVWLFRRTGSEWKTYFRSADLGVSPGVYNNLFPIKDAKGRTVRLVVVSAGYVMAFEVDFARM